MPLADVDKLHERLSQQRGITIDYQAIRGAGHFYETQMDKVVDIVGNHVDAALARLAA